MLSSVLALLLFSFTSSCLSLAVTRQYIKRVIVYVIIPYCERRFPPEKALALGTDIDAAFPLAHWRGAYVTAPLHEMHRSRCTFCMLLSD